MDGPLGRGDALDVPHEGFVVGVLESQPQAARGDVGRGHGLGLESKELFWFRGVGPCAGYAGQETGAVQGEGEHEV